MRHWALVALLGFVMAFAVGCKSESETPAPTPPEGTEKVIDDASKAMEEAVEKAPDVVKEGVEKTEKAVDDATK